MAQLKYLTKNIDNKFISFKLLLGNKIKAINSW